MNALDLLYLAVAAATAPRWSRKARGGWPQRFGRIEPVPDRPESGAGGRGSGVRSQESGGGDDATGAGRAQGGPVPRLLLHAVSVGEVNALRWLVPLLAPDTHVIISSTTDTGLSRAEALFAGSCDVRRFPLDASWAVRRFLDATRPDAIGLVELELWPNFMRECRRRGIPVGIISGRLSERSFRGYRRLRPLLRPMFARLEAVGAQDEDYAARFLAMGVRPERLSVTGSTKWDAAGEGAGGGGQESGVLGQGSGVRGQESGGAALGAALGIDPDRPLIVGGSTAEGEEALLHAAAPPGVQLLCAPRKPERFDEAAAAMPGCVRRSGSGGGGGGGEDRDRRGAAGYPGDPGERFLLDTLGELRDAYTLADVVVIGRSFGDLYGSDPIEPAALGKPAIIGPAHGNFLSAVRVLADAGALIISDREQLAGDLAALLADPARRRAMGEAAVRAVQGQRGASARHAAMLRSLLQAGPDRRESAAGGPEPAQASAR